MCNKIHDHSLTLTGNSMELGSLDTMTDCQSDPKIIWFTKIDYQFQYFWLVFKHFCYQ